MLDLGPKDIEILMRSCDWGTRVGEGHDYRGGEQLWRALLRGLRTHRGLLKTQRRDRISLHHRHPGERSWRVP
jgi:hypothetical protein